MKYLLITLLLSSLLCGNAAAENLGKMKVSFINNYQGHSGPLISMTSNPTSDQSGCEREDGYILAKTHPYYHEDYALLTLALATGLEVTITYNHGECLEGFTKIHSVVAYRN